MCVLPRGWAPSYAEPPNQSENLTPHSSIMARMAAAAAQENAVPGAVAGQRDLPPLLAAVMGARELDEARRRVSQLRAEYQEARAACLAPSQKASAWAR